MILARSTAVIGALVGITTNAGPPLSFSFSHPRNLEPIQREYKPLPGHNVRLVSEASGNFFIRGGAPTTRTLDSLFDQAKSAGRTVFVIDLRSPPRSYDLRSEGGRLVPKDLKKEVNERGGDYISISPFEENLHSVIKNATGLGHVYLGCHYGVNRTGYVLGRLSEAGFYIEDKEGIGSIDFESGARFQRSLNTRRE